MQVSANDPDICGLCNSNTILFDAEANETVCSKCGVVLQENSESLEREWGIYSGDDVESKARTGTPTSLFKWGRKRWCDQPGTEAKIQRMKPWNKISSNTRSYHRNLKNAFAILSTVKDKPSLKDALRKICL